MQLITLLYHNSHYSLTIPPNLYGGLKSKINMLATGAGVYLKQINGSTSKRWI